jgi:hypothetical protein
MARRLVLVREREGGRLVVRPGEKEEALEWLRAVVRRFPTLLVFFFKF